MKLKQLFKNKKKTTGIGIAVVCIVALIGGGYYLSRPQSKVLNTSNPQDNQTSEDTQIQDNLKGKENSQPSQTNPSSQSTNSTTQSTVANINDVSLQAIKNPDGTITMSLYGSRGNYDVEKCTNYQGGKCLVAWMAIVSNKTYEGHGGLLIDTMGTSETQTTYIVYTVVNGKRTASSKPLTLARDSFQDTTTITGS